MNLKISIFEYFFLASMLLAVGGCGDDITSFGNLRPYRVSSNSMLPALTPGDRILVDKQYYEDRKPQRDDVIIFEYAYKNTKIWLKRVIATEGDIVEEKDGIVFLNGKAIKESDAAKNVNFGPVTVAKDKVFVIGDKMDKSIDSRIFGLIGLERIKGKAVYIFWSNKLGKIGTQIR